MYLVFVFWKQTILWVNWNIPVLTVWVTVLFTFVFFVLFFLECFWDSSSEPFFLFLRSVSIIFAVALSLTPQKKLLFHPSPIVCEIAVGLKCNPVCVCFPSNESPLKCLASVWEFWVTGLLKTILYSIHTWSPPFSSARLAQAADFRPVLQFFLPYNVWG